MHQEPTILNRDEVSVNESSVAPSANEETCIKQLELVNEAARALSTALMTFLSVSVYVGIIIASTTDEMLIKGTPVKLPLFDAQIPIIGFYAVASWLVVLNHAYVIIYFKTLAQKLQWLRKETARLPPQTCTAFYERLTTLPYVQFFARPEKAGIKDWLSVFVPMGLVPLCLVLSTQFRFIVYRDDVFATTLQILAVIFEVGLLGWWLPRILRHYLNDSEISRPKTQSHIWPFIGFSILGVLISIVLLIFEVALEHKAFGVSAGEPYLNSLSEFNLQRVVLTQNVPDPKTLNQLKSDDEKEQDDALLNVSGFFLQGKDLRGAYLFEAVLPRADLRAKTAGMVTPLVRCTKVPVDTPTPSKKSENSSRCRSLLDGANLSWAFLQGALLDEASLTHAKLEGAQLYKANLIGADLSYAKLQGANLRRTNLDKAVFTQAEYDSGTKFPPGFEPSKKGMIKR
jgi:Pentapeptide repeats (8 copies)